MSYLLVPHEATATAATVSVLAVGESPGALTLEFGDVSRPVTDPWTVWQSHGVPRLWVQRIGLAGLEPGRRYVARLLDGSTERSSAVVATLPSALPDVGAPPFVCLLGSCFAQTKDQEGKVGAAFARLPAGARPHLKFLCGDQVYLDAPWQKYLANVYDEEDLKGELLATYAATWAQGGDGRGFREVLRDGATFLTSDDHELWNNAPSATPIVRQTWWPFGDHGSSWLRAATTLYDLFQTSVRSTAFNVGTLSFRVMDTRLARTADRSTFMPPAEVDGLRTWIDGLAGPGALVLGQPILVPETGIKGHLGDWALADHAQYHEMVRILHRARHDILILTGDVHYGRVAGCRLPSGASIIEVIASPLALVDGLVGGRWHAPPQIFPSAAVPGAAAVPVWVQDDHRLATNHFATLEFAAHGTRVKMAVRAWPIPIDGSAPASTLAFETYLQ